VFSYFSLSFISFFRVEIKNLGGGKHQLIFKKAELSDTGEVKCESGKLSSTCQVVVKKGEEKPVINFQDRVEGPVSKPIIFEVPYSGKFIIYISNKDECQ
jgi:hypothetical protein